MSELEVLIEDYERRIKTLNNELENTSDIDKIKRLRTKQSYYRTFLTELTRANGDVLKNNTALHKQIVSKAEGVSLPDSEYWKQRCILMEAIDEESPCDPDVTSDQIKAYANYHNFIKAHGQRQ